MQTHQASFVCSKQGHGQDWAPWFPRGTFSPWKVLAAWGLFYNFLKASLAPGYRNNTRALRPAVLCCTHFKFYKHIQPTFLTYISISNFCYCPQAQARFQTTSPSVMSFYNTHLDFKSSFFLPPVDCLILRFTKTSTLYQSRSSLLLHTSGY